MIRTILFTTVFASAAACSGKITTQISDSASPTDEPAESAGFGGGSGSTTGGGMGDSTGGGTTHGGTTDDAASGNASTDDGIDTGGSGARPEARTDVADMQRGSLSDGTPVSLSNVVVTSTMSIEAPGFYVQDVGGGEWSGVFVYTQAVETAAGLPTPAALTVNIGDVLNVSGTSKEFYDQTQLVLSSMSDIEVTGTGASVEVATLTVPPADWEPYEGVLVRLSNVRIAMVPDPSESEHAPVTDWGVSVADQLMDISMAEGTRYSSMTGILTYSWDKFRIAPRTSTDLLE